jgi:hypothetical protein
MAISPVTPIGSSVGPTTYYLSRMIDVQAGTYDLQVVAADAATVWIGADGNSTRMVLSAAPGGGVGSTQVFLSAGTQRIDVLLQDMTAGASSAYVALTLSRNGTLIYGTTAALWLWDTAPITDELLTPPSDPRLGLPVFSVLPNWKNGVLERLQWLTDILTSENAVEQRRSLRMHARRSFEASFMREGLRRAKLDTFFVAVGSKKVLAPIWHEQFKTPGLTTADTTLQFPAGTLALREFRAGDIVMANNGDPNDYDLLTIESVDLINDRITWLDSPVRNWPKGTRVFPMRVCMVLDNPSMSNVTDRVAQTALRFEVMQNDDEFSPDWGYCVPLFRWKPDRADPIAVDYSRTLFSIDNGTSYIHQTDPGERTSVAMKLSLKLFGREEMTRFRSFISNARGRAVRFYMPSFTHDVVPSGDMEGMYFDALPTRFAELMTRPQWSRVLLSFVFADGRPTIYRRVTSVQELGATAPAFIPNGERFHLDQFLPPIRLSEVSRVSFVMAVRFDQDGFEIKHYTDNGAAIGSEIVVRSVDGDGMPPIECMTTSKPYPYLTSEAMDIGFTITSGHLYLGVYEYQEALDFGFTITSGTLVTPLITNTMDDEALDFGFTIMSGDLRTLLITNTMDDEALDFGFTITGGDLDQVLIEYTMDDEALDFGFTITGGGLV